MVKRFLFASLIALVLLSGCQPQGPRISVTPGVQDLGKVPQKPVETTYTVRNTGTSLLKISKVVANCDCTKAIMDRSEIPAGETARLRVTMDPALLDLYGKIERVITINSNDPKMPAAKVLFRVEIEKSH